MLVPRIDERRARGKFSAARARDDIQGMCNMSGESGHECPQLRRGAGGAARLVEREFLRESVSRDRRRVAFEERGRASPLHPRRSSLSAGDSPSLPPPPPLNRIQITFPPSPSAEALCGHGTPPSGSAIILYGPLKAARKREQHTCALTHA